MRFVDTVYHVHKRDYLHRVQLCRVLAEEAKWHLVDKLDFVKGVLHRNLWLEDKHSPYVHVLPILGCF